MAEKSTATKTLENIKLNPPTPFTGKRTDFILFMQDVYVYLKVNKATYDNDDKKISFILSYLTGGMLLSGNSNLSKRKSKKARRQRLTNQIGGHTRNLWKPSRIRSDHTTNQARLLKK
jgi:hypothetical protein